jgi:hypothetical protein
MVVRRNNLFEVRREAKGSTVRTLGGGAVLNILQPVRAGVARFTIEGEGAEIWFCDQALIDAHTLHASAAAEA